MKNNPLVIPTLKPRNPTIEILKLKKGGVHRKSNKALRQKEKQELKGKI